jgi:hypothetical protein
MLGKWMPGIFGNRNEAMGKASTNSSDSAVVLCTKSNCT